MGERTKLSNGAVLYRDSAIPWDIEAAAMEALEESLEQAVADLERQIDQMATGSGEVGAPKVGGAENH